VPLAAPAAGPEVIALAAPAAGPHARA